MGQASHRSFVYDFLEMTSLTNKTNDARPADQICCDVGEVGEDEDTQHLQGLHPPAR